MPQGLTHSTDTFYGIICSGLTDKTSLYFIATNSSFSECVRKRIAQNIFLHSFSSSSNTDCTGQPYEGCQFNADHPVLSLSSSTSFLSCTFTLLSSPYSGGAISFTSGNSLTISDCIFTSCTTSVDFDSWEGGGAVCIKSGSLTVSSSLFISCTTVSYAGGIFAHSDCSAASVSFSTFINCEADHGSGLTTYYGPSSTTLSNKYISCYAYSVGGGLYHDGNSSDFISLSDSLFTNNKANSDSDTSRGGGAFEDYRKNAYTSKYSFSFFTGNTAPNGVGNDISVILTALSGSPITHCFTTTSTNSFWNNYRYELGWLPQGDTRSITNLRSIVIVSHCYLNTDNIAYSHRIPL